MRWRAHLAVLGLMILPIWVQPVKAEQPLGPTILLKETKFNSGKVREGKAIEHTFKVFNKGDKDLIIGNVRPG